MPDLLHEFWKNETSGMFGRVSAGGDRIRQEHWPDMEFQFEIWAPCYSIAKRLYEERAYGEFGKAYDDFPDTIYTAADAAEQREYLATRRAYR